MRRLRPPACWTNRDAINDLRGILDRSRNMKVKRAALTAMAQMPDPQLHGVYTAYLENKDEGLREAAAEGLARLNDPARQRATWSGCSRPRPRPGRACRWRSRW